MDLSVLRLALHEGYASPERLNEVPKEVQRHPASLDKILELVGLCAQLSSPNATADGEASWPALRWASQSFLSWANQSWDKIGVERLIEHLLLIWQMKTIFLVFYIGSLGSM
ncbi:unnamed protein product [Cladocopium goreaui]|uniref:Pentatricopeptide repeat-containing protein n=1 Tax=Cladocopium goreaui TaxID=2562237 RepID=A0A9P1BGZ7_9DINO|nr:unnamed protein product [Cladocopium goreaui]